MSYQCQTRGLAVHGIPDREAAIRCDGEGCIETIEITAPPPKWFLSGKAKRGWARIMHPDYTSTDYCPKCRRAPRPE